jgi:translation elongation factor Ts
MITAEQVKVLRDETGISIGKCREALEKTNGDVEAARAILREESAAAAAKKSDRELGAGILAVYIHNNKTTGTMVELLCETDFVAKNDDFVQLANQIAMHATAMSSKLETIKDEAFLLNPEITIGVAIQEATQKLGERVEIGRLVRMTVGGEADSEE